jgi:hypothetical protein
LLVAFGGITDRLIPLFAVGAFSAFTLSQTGMVVHWRRTGGRHARRSLALNAIGAAATGATLLVIAVSKFTGGAWLSVIVIPPLALTFLRIRRRRQALDREARAAGPLDLSRLSSPIVVLPLRRLDSVGRKGLRFSLTLSSDVRVVQVLAADMQADDLRGQWAEMVVRPARSAGLNPPELVVLPSEYRRFFAPLLRYVRDLAASNPARHVAVIVAERVQRRWYQPFIRHRATLLKQLLLQRGTPQIVIVDIPWYTRD